MAANAVLQAVYEPRFLTSSYGFRPGRSCHDAMRALHNVTFAFKEGAVVEIDISKYFNSIRHGPLSEFMHFARSTRLLQERKWGGFMKQTSRISSEV